MRDGAHEPARAVGRQLRVGVERDDIPAARDHADVADLHVKRRVVVAEHQTVELLDLSPLAFPSHPSPGRRIQPPRAMQEQKAAGAVPLVQRVDAARRLLDDRRVVHGGLGVGIGEVAENRVVNVRVRVAQVAQFELRQQVGHLVGRADQDRNDHDRAVVVGHAAAIVEFRQRSRRHKRGDEPVDQVDGQLAERQDDGQRHQQQHRDRRPVAAGVDHQAGRAQPRQHGDGAEVAQGRVPEHEPGDSFPPPRAVAQVRFQLEAAARDQVVADVVLPLGARPVVLGAPCLGACAHRHFDFRVSRASRQLLDRLAVPIACRKVHPRVGAGRVGLAGLAPRG